MPLPEKRMMHINGSLARLRLINERKLFPFGAFLLSHLTDTTQTEFLCK